MKNSYFIYTLLIILLQSCNNKVNVIYKYENQIYPATTLGLVSERFYKNETLCYVINRTNQQIYDSTTYTFCTDSIKHNIYLYAYTDGDSTKYDGGYLTPIDYIFPSVNNLFMDKYRVMDDYYQLIWNELKDNNLYFIDVLDEGRIIYNFLAETDLFSEKSGALRWIYIHLEHGKLIDLCFKYYYQKNIYKNDVLVELKDDGYSEHWYFFEYEDNKLKRVKTILSYSINQTQQADCRYKEFLYIYGKKNALHYVE